MDVEECWSCGRVVAGRLIYVYLTGHWPSLAVQARHDLHDEPDHIACPDCDCEINNEHVDLDARTRQHNIMAHRLTNCPMMLPALNWYMNAAVRVVPTAGMATMLARQRAAQATTSSAIACAPFFAHLLSPTFMCEHDNLPQQRLIIQATAALLSYSPQGHHLPDVEDFGPAPVIAMSETCSVSPNNGMTDEMFWDDVLSSVPNVRPVPLAHGPEAEAPVGVRPLRRSRRGGAV
jgi:hypothetical protein